MARYIQRITIGEGERWLGWEVDGIGTEVPGLTLADGLSDQDLQAKGVRKFFPMSFDEFVSLSAITNRPTGPLSDEDLAFRMDALRVALDRFLARGHTEIPKLLLDQIFGGVSLTDRRIEETLRAWERDGSMVLRYDEQCYLKLLKRLMR